VVDLETQGSSYRLNVYNTGQTVPEARRPMLFSPIRSKRSSKNRRQGLGLGLFLSRDIIQSYGGDIWYEAQKEGSNFVMSLPQNYPGREDTVISGRRPRTSAASEGGIALSGHGTAL
jgi:K+-sensing histidine kinase KdpD